MHEAFWNGLFDVRWEDAPLGPDAIRLVLRLCARGYSERTCRDYGHAVVHLGRVLSEELGGVDGIRDARVVEAFLGRHLPACCCYRRPPGRREEQVRRGLAHLLGMPREGGTPGPVVADGPPFHGLPGGYCGFLRARRRVAPTAGCNYRPYLAG